MPKPVVRYYINGKYEEATVSDVGDLQKLETSIKTDLVSAINSIYKGESGGIPSNLKERLESFQKEVSGVSEAVKGVNVEFEKAKSDIKRETAESIKSSTVEMLEKIKEVTDKEIKNSEAYKKQMETIYKEYKAAEKKINSDIESAERKIETVNENIASQREKLSLTDIGINEIKSDIDKVNGELSAYAKKTNLDLMEARVQEAESKLKLNAEGLELKANKGELDSAVDRVAKFESSLQATAKKLESKLSREEVIKEIDNEKEYGANLLKGTRGWENWTLSGKAEKLPETYRNKTLLNIHSDSDKLEYSVDNLQVGETYIFSLSAMTKAESVSISMNGKDMKQQSNGDTTLGDGYNRLYIEFIPKKSSEKLTVSFKNIKEGSVVNVTSPKLEKGLKNTAWIPHVDDIHDITTKYDSELKQLADSLTAQLSSVKKINETIVKHDTRITAASDGIKQVSESVKNIDGKVTNVKADYSKLSDEMKSKITSVELDKALDGLTMQEGNIIHNSNFIHNFDDWKHVDKLYHLTEIDDTKFANINRSGLRADMIAPLTTHYFEVSNKDRLNISFDVISKIPESIDDNRIMYVEIFDSKETRLARKEYRIPELVGSLIKNKMARGNCIYAVDNESAVKASISFALYRNGELSFSKLNVTKGDIKSLGWSPSPRDIELITTKLESQITQKADGVYVENVKKRIDSMATEFVDVKSKVDLTAEKFTEQLEKVKGDMINRTEVEKTADGITRRITEVESGVSKKIDDIQLKHGEDSYSINVLSTRGSVFRNGVVSTVLKAYIYKGSKDVTDKLTNECFSWRRDSDDSAGDIKWNESHLSGRKQVEITEKDIVSRATFSCSIDIDMAEKILIGRE